MHRTLLILLISCICCGSLTAAPLSATDRQRLRFRDDMTVRFQHLEVRDPLIKPLVENWAHHSFVAKPVAGGNRKDLAIDTVVPKYPLHVVIFFPGDELIDDSWQEFYNKHLAVMEDPIKNTIFIRAGVLSPTLEALNLLANLRNLSYQLPGAFQFCPYGETLQPYLNTLNSLKFLDSVLVAQCGGVYKRCIDRAKAYVISCQPDPAAVVMGSLIPIIDGPYDPELDLMYGKAKEGEPAFRENQILLLAQISLLEERCNIDASEFYEIELLLKIESGPQARIKPAMESFITQPPHLRGGFLL